MEKVFKETFEEAFKMGAEIRDKSLNNGHRVIQQLYNYFSVENPVSMQKPLIIDGKTLRDFFSYNHNPLKGETANSELDKWLLFLRGKRIKFEYDLEKDRYTFSWWFGKFF